MRAALLLLLLVSTPGVEEYHGYLGRWVEVRATAYSPEDPEDQAYRASKGERWKWITADGRTDVRRVPYGLAVPLRPDGTPWVPYGTRVIIPAGYGYLDHVRADDRVFPIDDTGAHITHATGHDQVYFDFRFQTTESARRWAGPQGWRAIRLFVIARPAPRVEIQVDAGVAHAMGTEGVDEMRRAMLAAVSPSRPLTPTSATPQRPVVITPDIRVSPYITAQPAALPTTTDWWVITALVVGSIAVLYLSVRFAISFYAWSAKRLT